MVLIGAAQLSFLCIKKCYVVTGRDFFNVLSGGSHCTIYGAGRREIALGRVAEGAAQNV